MGTQLINPMANTALNFIQTCEQSKLFFFFCPQVDSLKLAPNFQMTIVLGTAPLCAADTAIRIQTAFGEHTAYT